MIIIDPAAKAPPYEQITSQIRAALASGELSPGDRLPTVRELAADLSLAPNTVARAFRDLERTGFIETRGRKGSFVPLGLDDTARRAREAAEAYARMIVDLDIDEDHATRYLAEALAALRT